MKRRSIGPSVSFFAFQDIITAVVGIFILIVVILVLELTERVEAASNPPAADVQEITSTIDSLRTETERLTMEYNKQIAERADFTGLNKFNREAKTNELKAALQAATEQLATVQEQRKKIQQRLAQEQEAKSKLLLQSAELKGERDRIADRNLEFNQLERTIERLKSSEGLIYRDQTSDGRSLCVLTLNSSGIESKDGALKQVRNFRDRDWIDSFERWLRQLDLRTRHFLLLVEPSGAPEFDRVRKILSAQNCVYGFDVVGSDNDVQLSFEWGEQK